VKLNRSVFVMMMAASLLWASGCKKQDKQDNNADDNASGSNSAGETDTANAPPPAPAKEEPVNDGKALPAPPADKTEEMGVAPSPHHAWVHGYWYWHNREYLWQNGYWADYDQAVNVAPPRLRYESPGVSPGVAYFWAPGYWHWGGAQYAWAPGHWTLRRDGYAYAHPYWEVVGGRWYRRGWGWERRDAGWDRRYGGWRAHGDVWVHSRHYGDYERRGHVEGWGRHH
jgi:hypothetical protein